MPREKNAFLEAFKSNKKIQGMQRKEICDVLSYMYCGLEKLGYLRWLNDKVIDRIKELSIQEFDKNDENEHQNSNGFYICGTNTVKLRNLKDKRTMLHELLHFIVDERIYENPLNPINEGLTEYICGQIERINNTRGISLDYLFNTDLAELLHRTIGDSFVKAYFIGISDQFKKELASYLSRDGQESREELNKFNISLARVHIYLNQINVNKDAGEQYIDIRDNQNPILREYIKNILVNSIRKKAHSLEFFRDGKIDCEALKNEIIETKKMAIRFVKDFILYTITDEILMELEESIVKASLSVALQECGFDEESALEIAGGSIKEGEIKRDIFGISYPTMYLIDDVELERLVNREDLAVVAKKMIRSRFNKIDDYVKDGTFDTSAFLMDALFILDKIGVKGRDRQTICENEILPYVPESVDKEFIGKRIGDEQNLYVALYKKRQVAVRDLTENRFVKIDANLLVEKRDNEFYILRYDDTKGEFIEQRLLPKDRDKNMNFSKEQMEKFGESVKKITYVDRSKEGPKVYSIYFDEDFSNVEVNDKKPNVLYGISGLADSYLTDEIMTNIMSKLSTEAYVISLQDRKKTIDGLQYPQDVDETIKIINFKLFAVDLKKSVSMLPSQYHEQITNSAISALIKSIYGDFEYDISQIKHLITGNEFLNNPINDEDTVQKLLEITKELNEKSRETIKGKRKCSQAKLPNPSSKTGRLDGKEGMNISDLVLTVLSGGTPLDLEVVEAAGRVLEPKEKNRMGE